MAERILFTSSYTTAAGNCVQFGPPPEMRVSSYSGPTGGQCVEIGQAYDHCVALGDSKPVPEGMEKEYVYASPAAFTMFAAGLESAEFAGF
ncbi:MAG TPA: DUF397 domain-containing protein [Candidatus Saccharimonadales bacterium]|nr:DUF397 domain-containing protein [Candidatus Saccharimonadales bacterium]